MLGSIFENAKIVAVQAVSLYIMMALGFVLYKAKMFGEEAITGMTNVLLWAVTPCLLIDCFSREFDRALANSLLTVALVSAVGIVITLPLAALLFRKHDIDRRKAIAYAAAFPNCGFMGLPLAAALFGAEGVMYASVFVASFNVVQWTFGVAFLSGKGFSVKRLILNPGIIGLAIALPLFLCSVELPPIVGDPVKMMADINTPLAMVVIGGHLARADLRKAVRDAKAYAACAYRLLAVPAVVLAVLLLVPFRLDTLPKAVLLIEFAAPSAATSVLLSHSYGRDSELAGRCVALSTLLSIVTLPLFASIGGLLL